MSQRDKIKKEVDDEIIKKGKAVVNDFDDSSEFYVQAKRPESKLISIRLPIDMIRALRQIATLKGDIGYQQMIKTYIAEGILEDSQKIQASVHRPFLVLEGSGTSSNMEIFFTEPPKIISGDYIKTA